MAKKEDISYKTAQDISLMREACQIAADTLVYIEQFIKPGVTTLDINDLCHEYIMSRGGYPSCLNYHGFPKSICTSLNYVVCHGIPSKKDIIKDGDILNVDVTVYKNGFHGDTNKTFLVGSIDPKIKKLVDVTYECLMAGISVVRPGATIGDIGETITNIAHANNYSVVVEYCGHGIGRNFHEAPQVVHVGKKGTGVLIEPGMTFTIEPMINIGRPHCKVLRDKWTVVTADNSLSAQFEHTIFVTNFGAEILTIGGERRPLYIP